MLSLRLGALNCASVTAYVVSVPCGPGVLNGGSDSFALFLITQVEKSITEVTGRLSHDGTFLAGQRVISQVRRAS